MARAIVRATVVALAGALVCLVAGVAVGLPLIPTAMLVASGFTGMLWIVASTGAFAYSQVIGVFG